jgi:protein-tyrosine phosphatase
MDYNQILSCLFLGSHPQAIDDIDRLQLKVGISAVMNLQTDDDMRAVNLTWEPLEAHYTASSIELVRIPVRDFNPVDLCAKLPECVRALDQLLAGSHSVYLHCTAGTGRSPTVAIAYLHWCSGWDLDQAEAYVKQRRACAPNVEAIRLAIWASAK